MNDGNAEVLYLQRRVAQSLAMAAVAPGPCARIAHVELARLYREAIEAIMTRSRRPTLHALFSSDAATKRTNPISSVGMRQKMHQGSQAGGEYGTVINRRPRRDTEQRRER